MLISDQQLKIEFSSHSFFYKIESLISFPLSSAITFLFRAVCFSSPHDADIGENRLCDQLKECLCVRQGAGTTVYASPHSVSLSFTFLKPFNFTYIVRSPRFIPIPCLYSVRSPHFLPNPCFIPCQQSAVGVLYWSHFPPPFSLSSSPWVLFHG